MTYSNSMMATAMRVAEIKNDYALSVECKLVRRGSEISVYTESLELARVLQKEGFAEVYVR